MEKILLFFHIFHDQHPYSISDISVNRGGVNRKCVSGTILVMGFISRMGIARALRSSDYKLFKGF
jgi:hypothetical protein